jgi:hypothetical protein
LIICDTLPRGPAEYVLSINEKCEQLPARKKKDAMLQELVKNDKFVYLRLVHDVFDKYSCDRDALFNIWYHEPYESLEVSLHVRYIAFDAQMYHSDLWADEQHRWDYYKKMVLCCKYKKEYIASLHLMLKDSITNNTVT